ncbi:MAG: helix-hairpin-helix domain-containing protein [Mogibacterium sp.]|nr:helix-hairpin-helix domain-containing protein [Mogibacterium sp.]
MKEVAAEKIRNAIEDLLNDKKTLVKILSIILILLLAGILRLHSSNAANISIEQNGAETAQEAEDTEAPADDGDAEFSDTEDTVSTEIIYVDIGGAVEEPGVYQVAAGTRLFEVVAMAGGLTDKADIDSVNQAAFVEDGAKVIIPKKGSKNKTSSEDASSISSSSASVSENTISDYSQPSGLININTAAKEELTTLSGIGDVIAERIIEYRSTKPFKTKEDIKSVKGIGDAIYSKIKDSITC